MVDVANFRDIRLRSDEAQQALVPWWRVLESFCVYCPQEMTVQFSCVSCCLPEAELVTLPSYHEGEQLQQSVLQASSRDHLKDPTLLKQFLLLCGNCWHKHAVSVPFTFFSTWYLKSNNLLTTSVSSFLLGKK